MYGGGRALPLRLEVARLGVGAIVFWGDGLRGQGHKESETAGTLSLPRPIALGSSTAQTSVRWNIHAAVTNQPFIWIMGCRSMLLRECMGGWTWPLRLEVARLGVEEEVFFGGGEEGRVTERARRRGLFPCHDR